jgi:hypothetical protein
MTMRHEEAVAKRVLEMAFPGAQMLFRPEQEQSHGEYDFNLRYRNGELAAVEVTSSRDPATTQLHKEVFEKNGGSIIQAVKCKKNWCIHIGAPDLRKLRRDVDKYLADLESAGIEKFEWNDYIRSDCPKEITAICHDLSLISARSFPADGAVEIRVSCNLGPLALGNWLPTMAAEREIGPNKDKLGRATTRERHLVVYVDKSNARDWLAMTSSAPPNKIPEVPTEITHLWQIAQTSKDQFAVWRATSTEPWQTVDLLEASQRYSEGENE